MSAQRLARDAVGEALRELQSSHLSPAEIRRRMHDFMDDLVGNAAMPSAVEDDRSIPHPSHSLPTEELLRAHMQARGDMPSLWLPDEGARDRAEPRRATREGRVESRRRTARQGDHRRDFTMMAEHIADMGDFFHLNHREPRRREPRRPVDRHMGGRSRSGQNVTFGPHPDDLDFTPVRPPGPFQMPQPRGSREQGHTAVRGSRQHERPTKEERYRRAHKTGTISHLPSKWRDRGHN
jgi:hypothetical protein